MSLIKKYKKEFPKGTPIVVACEKGRLEDLKAFVAGHDVDGTGVSVKKLLEEVGKDSNGWGYNTLIASAYYEQPEVLVQLLDYGVDPSITDSYGRNALHWSAFDNKKSTRCVESLLKKMPLESINKKDEDGRTPLDCAYRNNRSPIRQEIIDLMRSKGAKRASELERSPTEVETNTTCEIKTLEDQLKTLREIKALEDQLKTLRGQLKRKRDTYDSSNKRQCV